MPKFTIIVPVFNGSRYLPYFLDSLLKAILPNTELIFVDDGSSEPVLQLIPDKLAGSPIIKLRSEYNLGYSATVNRGFTSAKGDIILQLNTDLVLDRNCIKAMIDLIEKTSNVGIVGSKQILPTSGLIRHIGMAFGSFELRHIFKGMPMDHPLCRKTRNMQLVSGATVAMTRKVLDEIGPLDERYFNTLENFDHCMKAHVRGFKNFTCAESIAYHWVSQSGPSRFARVHEGETIFWSDWGSTRNTDLGIYVEEAIDHILNTNPQFEDYSFEPLCLCRSSDESILLEALKRLPVELSKKRRTRILNSPFDKIWLPMELPHNMMVNPSPYIYLVDQVDQLFENHMWFQARHRVVESEIILDARAVAMTSHELLAISKGGPK